MNILVTGATGFVGGHLVERLILEGHNVYALVRSPSKANFFPSSVHMIRGDLATSGSNKWLAQLPDALDTVIHTAGIVHSFNSAEFYRVNSEATRQLIQDLAPREGMRFILVSSLAAIGPTTNEVVLTEESPENPVSVYGKSKLRAEKYLKATPASWSTAIVRPPMVIGPRDPAILDVFKMVKSRKVVVPGKSGFDNRYSFVCVHDLVELINELTKFRGRDEAFFCAYEKTCSFEEIIMTIAKELGIHSLSRYNAPLWALPVAANVLKVLSNLLPINPRLTPDKVNELKSEAWLCSDAKAREWLGFKARYDLKETIKITAKDYLSRGVL